MSTRNIEQIVERQLATWRERRRQQPDIGNERDSSAHPKVVVVSYAPHAGGEAIATHLAKALALPHHDHEIVEHIAASAKVHLATVEMLDRHVQSRIDEYIAALFSEHNFDRGDYLRLLGRTVVSLWEHGPCVISGHGAVHFVPREHALTVRLTAPVDARARRLAQVQDIGLPHAQRTVRHADAEHEAFHRRFFGVHAGDAEHYDLIVDTSRLRGDLVVALLAQAYRQRFGPPGTSRTQGEHPPPSASSRRAGFRCSTEASRGSIGAPDPRPAVRELGWRFGSDGT